MFRKLTNCGPLGCIWYYPPSLLGTTKLPSLASCSSAHPIQDLLPCEKLFHWLCITIPQGLLSASQFLLCLVVPPFGLGSGHLVVPRTRTSMTQSIKFFQSLRSLFPISSDQFCKHLNPPYLSVKTLTRVGSASDFKWRYINV